MCWGKLTTVVCMLHCMYAASDDAVHDRPPLLFIHSFVPFVSRSFVCLSGQILLPWCLTNGLSNINETFKDYSLAPTDDLIKLWMSEVKVTAGHRGGKGIHVDASSFTWVFVIIRCCCQTWFRCRWQTRATQCPPCCTQMLTFSVITWWPMTVTSLSHWPST